MKEKITYIFIFGVGFICGFVSSENFYKQTIVKYIISCPDGNKKVQSFNQIRKELNLP